MDIEKRARGHFDRFNFCNAAPDLDVTNVQFTLLPLPNPAGNIPNVSALGCREEDYCGQLLEVLGFTCAATVTHAPSGRQWQINWQYNSPAERIEQIAVGIAQECPDPDTGDFGPVPFGVVVTETDQRLIVPFTM